MMTFESLLIEFTAALCRIFGISSETLDKHRPDTGERPQSVFRGSRRDDYKLWDQQSVTLYRGRYGFPTG